MHDRRSAVASHCPKNARAAGGLARWGTFGRRPVDDLNDLLIDLSAMRGPQVDLDREELARV
jgi:hypothetical protein